VNEVTRAFLSRVECNALLRGYVTASERVYAGQVISLDLVHSDRRSDEVAPVDAGRQMDDQRYAARQQASAANSPDSVGDSLDSLDPTANWSGWTVTDRVVNFPQRLLGAAGPVSHQLVRNQRRASSDVVDLEPVDAQVLAAEGEAAHVERDEADNAMAVGTLA
jgi:hypothetical protein